MQMAGGSTPYPPAFFRNTKRIARQTEAFDTFNASAHSVKERQISNVSTSMIAFFLKFAIFQPIKTKITAFDVL